MRLCQFLLLSGLACAADPPAFNGLVGRWTNGRLSTIQYQDAYTGVARPPAGNHFAYEFRPDGTYVFTGFIQNTLYNCTTVMFGEESGTYELNAAGTEVSLHPKENPFRMTNSCAPSTNSEAPGKLTERGYRFVISGTQLALTATSDRAVQTFHRQQPR